MAKQKGLNKYVGIMDGWVHFSTRYGDFVRKMGEISKERRATAPEFENTRNSNSELGYASRLGKLLRLGVREITLKHEPGDTNTRLSNAVRSVLKLDDTAPAGSKRILPQHVRLLKGFEWNTKYKVETTVKTAPKLNIDPSSRLVSLRMPALKVADALKQFKGATHVEITLGITVANYDTNSQSSIFDSTGLLKATEKRPIDILLECEIPKAPGTLTIIGLGIQPYCLQGGEVYKLPTGNGYMILDAIAGA
jgi:hypothetical protein